MSLPPDRKFRRVHRQISGWGTLSAVVTTSPPGTAATHPPVLLLHGFTGSSGAWGPALLSRLASRGPVVAVDLPGHGESDWPGEDRIVSVPAVAGLLAGLLPGWLAEAAGGPALTQGEAPSPPATWIGYSMGGRIALAAALLHPEQVGGLVLESTSPGLDEPRDREARIRADELLAGELEVGGMEPFVERWLALPLFAGLRNLPGEQWEEERARRLQNHAPALAGVLRRLGTGGQPPFRDRLSRIRAPTLLLNGEADPKFRREAIAMNERIPGSRRIGFPGVGHVPHREAPGEWTRVVENFLGSAIPGRS